MERKKISGSIKIHIAKDNLRLPQDLIEEILSRLPVKSLLKFRKVEIVGSCNGLVCILEDTGGLILCNPSTRMAMNLPDIGVGENLVGKAFTKYGFGYDESSDDYKTNSWKTLKDEQDSDIQFEGGGTFASGNLHWVTGNREIVSFDLKSEVDGMVEQPSYPKGDIFPTLGVIDGCLSVISVLCFKDYQHAYFDVWVMKEYGVKESWVKVITIPNFRRRHYSIGERLVSFSRGPKGEILVIHSSTFVVYYPKAKLFPRLGVIGGCLSVHCDYRNCHFDVWVMKKYGVNESWVKVSEVYRVVEPLDYSKGDFYQIVGVIGGCLSLVCAYYDICLDV
ncbi:hypothetical protein ACS0TY_000549 [Phlomoides rotata]